MDGDLADVVGVGKAGVAPRRAAVVRAEDARPGIVKLRGFLRLTPEPSQRTFGSDGARAMWPMPSADWFSKIGVQVRPRLTVFQRFPGPKATYIVAGRAGSIWTEAARAEFITGPIGIHLRLKVDDRFKAR